MDIWVERKREREKETFERDNNPQVTADNNDDRLFE